MTPHFVCFQVLTSQQEILELDLENLLSSCEFTENVLRYGNEAEIMLVKPQMVSRLQSLNDHESQCEPEENEVLYLTNCQLFCSYAILFYRPRKTADLRTRIGDCETVAP